MIVEDFETRAEKKLCDHDERIRDLELSEVRQSGQIANLCEKLEEFTKIIDRWMEFAQDLYWKVLGAAGGIIGVFVAFFIWYVQHLQK